MDTDNKREGGKIMTYKCPSCGKELIPNPKDSNYLLCENCNKNFKAPGSSTDPSSKKSSKNSSGKKKSKKKKGNGILIVILILLLLVAAAAAIFFFIKNRENKEKIELT